MTSPDSFLSGGAKAVSFGGLQAQPAGFQPYNQDAVWLGMQQLEPAQIVQNRNFDTGELEWWDDAKTQKKEAMCLVMQTAKRNPQDPNDDGIRRLFISGKSMKEALAKAMADVGAVGAPQPGCLIDMAFVGVEPVPGGKKTRRLYASKYTPPSASFLAQHAPAQPPAQQGAPGGYDPFAPQGQQAGPPAQQYQQGPPAQAPQPQYAAQGGYPAQAQQGATAGYDPFAGQQAGPPAQQGYPQQAPSQPAWMPGPAEVAAATPQQQAGPPAQQGYNPAQYAAPGTPQGPPAQPGQPAGYDPFAPQGQQAAPPQQQYQQAPAQQGYPQQGAPAGYDPFAPQGQQAGPPAQQGYPGQ
jgi:hypothetical protein